MNEQQIYEKAYKEGYDKGWSDGNFMGANRWIPISEKLPEKNMMCLVAVGRFGFTEIATYSDLMETIDHRIFYQGNYGHQSFKNITQYVKAWMPLPEPYRAESEGDEE